MEQGFIDALKTVFEKHGKEYFLEAKKCKAIVSDYTGSEYRIERGLLFRAVEAGVTKAIIHVAEGDMESCLKVQQRELEEEQFMAATMAWNIVNLLAHVLRGVELKEIQAGPEAGSPAAASPAAASGATAASGAKAVAGKGGLDFDEAMGYYWDEQYDKALPILQALAEQGHVGAQLRIGIAYGDGKGVTSDPVKSAEWTRKAAEQGHVPAQREYANDLFLGFGVTQDIAKGIEWWRKAADQGDATAQYYLGEVYRNGDDLPKDLAKAVELIRKAAVQDHEDAEYRMGYFYEYGEGVEQDYAKAAEWYKKAAEWLHLNAMFNLGYFYEKGIGVEQDYKEAVKWYYFAANQEPCHQDAQCNLAALCYLVDDDKRAAEIYLEYAEKGFAKPQNGLGFCYYEGKGVAQDYVKAAEWFRKAAVQGNVNAQINLGGLYEQGLGVTQSYGQAFEWYSKAAEAGYSDGQFSLGWAYQKGEGVGQDYAKALEWYRKAADQGNCMAYNNLADLYLDGEGVAQDEAKGAEWYRKSAEKGNSGGQNGLGWCYREGKGVTQDYAKAFEWFRKSADQNDGGGLNNLGRCYMNGEGVSKDYAKAAELLHKAIEQGNEKAKENLAKLEELRRGSGGGSGGSSSPPSSSPPPRPVPQQQSSSSSSGSDTTAFERSGFARFLEGLGFENAPYTSLGLNPVMSIILGVVITVGVTLLGFKIFSTFPIWAIIIVFALAFASLRFTHKVLIVVFSVVAAIGIGITIFGGVNSKPKQVYISAEPSVTIVTVTSNTANFRDAPSTSGKVIKTLKKGDTLTVTDPTSNGWVPAMHGEDAGFISQDLVVFGSVEQTSSSGQAVTAVSETQTKVPTSFSDLIGTWKRNNYGNTLTFTANTLKSSSQDYTWNFESVSGSSFRIRSEYNSGANINISLTNGNMIISGDSGGGEDNWNGTWVKQ